MRTRKRLKALQDWTYNTICKGRLMKAPGRDEYGNEDISIITRQEPQVYLGWHPTRLDKTGAMMVNPMSICPGILICPGIGNAKYVEPQRFDRYAGINRAQELGQWLSVNVMFAVYEPGIRLPGFTKSAASGALDIKLIQEGTEEGLLTLTDWMDDFMDALIAEKTIPGCDLCVDEASIEYMPLLEGNYIADKRPLYYGFIAAKFQGYSEGKASKIEELLK